MKAILIATKETIEVIKAGEYTNIYVTEDGSQSFLGDELILLDEVKEEAKERDWEEVRINAAIAAMPPYRGFGYNPVKKFINK